MGEGSAPSPRWAQAALAVVVLIVLARTLLGGVQPYGSDGAEYIELAALADALQQVRDGPGWSWGFLQQLDEAFPPGLHLITGPWAWAVGLDAGWVAVSGVAWLLLLAGACGALAHRLQPGSGWFAAAAVSLVPAVHGSATRYYYDLLMVALLWAMAALLGSRRWAPLAPAVLLVSLVAALVKWTSLAMVPIVLAAAVAATANRHERASSVGRAAVALLVTASGFGFLRAYLGDAGIETSFGLQASILDQQDPVLAGLAPGALAPGRFARALTRLTTWSFLDLAFLVLRPLVSVGAPLLVLVAVPSIRRADRRPQALAAVTVLGVGAFLLLFVPVLDDRFWLPAVPAVAIAAGSGLARDRRLAAVALSLGVLVALEFHASPRAPWNLAVTVLPAGGRLAQPGDSSGECELGGGYKDRPAVVVRGIFASSSVEDRGWTRRDEQPPARTELREAVAERVAELAPGCLGLPWEQAAIGDRGDYAWWQWTTLARHLRGGSESPPPPTLSGLCEGGLPRRCEPDVVALPRGERASRAALACLGGDWAIEAVGDGARLATPRR